MKTSNKILVCGAGGFVGSHLVDNLKKKGYYVIGADLKLPEFKSTTADYFYTLDLRDQYAVKNLITPEIDTVYQLAADMGGANYIFTGDNDADIMHNSAQINLNVANCMVSAGVKNLFYTSSACIYPAHNQTDPDNPNLRESTAYPAHPDSEYGWEKIFGERLFLSFAKNYKLRVRIARLHNVFGSYCTWKGGKEKAPAALCRKIAECKNEGTIEVYGSGIQTRSFLYIDDCIEGIHKLMKSDYQYPINIGSARIISINELINLISKIANKKVYTKHIQGPIGVMGRTSNNELIKQILNWEPPDNLEIGLKELYFWIERQIKNDK